MGVIGNVGRKRPRARFAMAMLYLALGVGAITTVYPFLVMASTGLKGPTDQNDNQLIPAYLVDDKDLVVKYVDDKYAGNPEAIAATNTGDVPPRQAEIYRKYLSELPVDMYQVGFRMNPAGVTSKLNHRYQSWLETRFPSLSALNKAYLEEDTSWETVQPPSEDLARVRWKPRLGPKWDDWLKFKEELPIEYRIPVTVRAIYQTFIQTKFRNSFSEVPLDVRGTATKFSQLELPAKPSDLAEFRAHGLPERFRQRTAETLWMAALGNPISGDALLGSVGVKLPLAAFDDAFARSHASELRKEFMFRNFGYVYRYLTVNGGAFANTILYAALAIFTTLTVNPLAAYVLSRYPIRRSGQILVFLLATMAFPAEVTMIPNFLLLKNLHLLNTMAALVLPGAASGYMIFLLKGFFDSLPSDLFEASALDGAKEWTMLRRIALPLSRPVLGYFALLTFFAAYGNFMYAFLVAQDQRLWTVMVFLYQLSGVAPKYVMMAAFTLAALPTLLVFLSAQQVILRGIVLPGER